MGVYNINETGVLVEGDRLSEVLAEIHQPNKSTPVLTEHDMRAHMILPPPPKLTVHVAMLQPFHDGSGGSAKVLGVYGQKFRAEARCYRELKALGYDQPTDVVALILDADYDLEELDNPS